MAGALRSRRMMERRSAPRTRLDLFFNKYLDGHPHLCRLLDLSSRGLLARTVSEPKTKAEAFTIELQLPGASTSVWAWARSVRHRGEMQALELIGMNDADRQELERALGQP
jgi:hypothetical protein